MLGRASVALVVLLATGARAAEPRCGVYVDHTGEDIVGQRFAFALKERLAKSPRFTSVDSKPDARFIIYLASIEADGPERSAIALAYMVRGNAPEPELFALVSQLVVRRSVSEMVDASMAALDAQISKSGLRQLCTPQPK